MATQTVYFNNPQDITNLQASTTVLQSTTTSMSGSVSSLQASTTVLQSTTTSMSGSVSSLQTTVSTQVLPTVVVTNNNFTAQAGYKYIWVPTGSFGGLNVTLPSSPVSGDTIQIADGGAILGGPFGPFGGSNYTGTTITTTKAIVGDITVSANSSTGGLWPFRIGILTLVYDGSSSSRQYWHSNSNNVNQFSIVGNPLGSVPIPTIQGNPLNTNGSATSGLGATPITSKFPTSTYATTAAQLAAVPHPVVPQYYNIYAEPPAIAQTSQYVQNNLHVGDLCDCNTLQVRGEIVSDYNQNIIVRGGINVEPGSQEQTALGLDGGFTFTDPSMPTSNNQYKTQMIDGVITTRKMLPRNLKPTVLPKNIILNINDGMGANGSWAGKVAADAIVKHAIFSTDMTGASYDYFHLGTTSGLPIRPTTLDQFKFAWDLTTVNGVSNTGGVSDFYMNYQPIGAEHVYMSNYPEPNNYYAPVETNRHYMWSSVSPPETPLPSGVTSVGITYGNANTQNTVSYMDSANSAWTIASGRVGGQNTLAVTSFTNSTFNSYGVATVANSATSGNPSTTYATAQTITELCKAYGKATCIISTCNIEHATPAAFAGKSQHRQQYAMNTRYTFNNTLEGSVRPDLIIGALPYGDGADFYASDNYQYYFGEIDSTWATIPTGTAVIASGQPLLSATQINNKTCTAAQYAQYYGYNLYTGALGLASATGVVNGVKAKVFVQTTSDSAIPGLVSGPDTDINKSTLQSTFGGSTGAVFRMTQCYRDDASATGRIVPKHTDLLYHAKRILESQTFGRGYFMMFENSMTDWGGHASDFMSAGFETAESQKAMFNNYLQAYTGSDHILMTCDHEVVGWTFATTGANNGLTASTNYTQSGQSVKALPAGCEYLDLQDSMNVSPQGFYYHYQQYEASRKVALGLNFITMPVAFSVNPASVAQYTPSYTTVPLYLASGAVSVTLNKVSDDGYNATAPLAGPLGGYAGTGGAAATNYRDWVIDNLAANQATGSIVNYLPFTIYNSAGTTAKMRGRIYYDAAVPNKLILEQAAYDCAVYSAAGLAPAATGPVPVSFLGIDWTSDRLIINMPVSMIGRWFVEKLPYGSDNADDTFLSSLLQGQYLANNLNRVVGVGHICDSSTAIRAGMLDAFTVYKNSLGGAGAYNNKGIVSQIHLGILADLCSYYNPSKLTVCALINSTGQKTSSTAPVTFISQGRYHSMSTCPLWVKSYDGFINFDTAIVGGPNTMANFLSNQTITGAGIRKIMDGTI